MTQKLSFSIIIPIYNRPEEIQELLQSLSIQTYKDFEVLIIEDGSTIKCEDIVESFKSYFQSIRYVYQENTGPAYARNHGMQLASGNYFIFLDSDCIIPPQYMQEVVNELNTKYVDAFGGPDAAHESFSDLQKAINYTMTSMFTTGGIRGGKNAVDKFQPRSFNMGLSKEVFEKTKGFGRIFPGEDPDLTLRIWESGFDTRLFPKAFVYHKRRISFEKFSKQVYSFGKVRPMLNFFHPNYTKITFWFPAVFMLGTCAAVLLCISSFLAIHCCPKWVYFLCLPMFFVLIYIFLIGIDASIKNKSIKIGLLSIVTVFVQFFSYGTGFLQSWWAINVLGKHPEEAFPKNFKQN